MDGKGQTLVGRAIDIRRGTLPTGTLFGRTLSTVASQTFTLIIPVKGVPGKTYDQKLVEVRARRIHGTVYEDDQVEVVPGRIDEDGIVRAREVRDKATGAILHGYRPEFPWRKLIAGILLAVGILLLIFALSVSPVADTTAFVIVLGVSAISVVAGILILRGRRRQKDDVVLNGKVQGPEKEKISARSEPHWWSGTITIFNFKLDTERVPTTPEDTRYKMVELRAPHIRGTEALDGDNPVEVQGREAERNVFKAVRILDKKTGATIRAYRPLPPLRLVLSFILLLTGAFNIFWSLAYLSNVLWPDFPEFLVLFAVPILIGGAISLVAGLILIVAGAILLIRRRPGRFELVIGAVLLVPVIAAALLVLAGLEPTAIVAICTLPLTVVLFVAGALLARRESLHDR